MPRLFLIFSFTIILCTPLIAQVIEIENEAQFERLKAAGTPLVVKFYSPKCPACKEIAEDYQALSQEFGAITFAQVNVERQKRLADRYNIIFIPHIYLIKGTAEYPSRTQAGGSFKTDLTKELRSKLLSLNTHQVDALEKEPTVVAKHHAQSPKEKPATKEDDSCRCTT